MINLKFTDLMNTKMYSMGKLKIKGKRVAYIVEALTGAYLSLSEEVAAL